MDLEESVGQVDILKWNFAPLVKDRISTSYSVGKRKSSSTVHDLNL